MPVKKQLQIRIYPDGKIEGKTLGIKGSKCTDYIVVLEKLLHARAIESAYTAEYHQSETRQQNETIAAEVQLDEKVQP